MSGGGHGGVLVEGKEERVGRYVLDISATHQRKGRHGATRRCRMHVNATKAFDLRYDLVL